MRQIVLDTETTGLEPAEGHRIIEIGAVEMNDRRLTGRRFHYYVNPDRRVDLGALEVHGITNEFLADKPRFAEIAEEFIQFIRDGELVIHNAPFDVGFLNAELHRLGNGLGAVEQHASVFDTLELARSIHPGMKNSLDALCRRYEVDNSHRNLHGALLDAQILAEVYLRMTGGQTSLSLEIATEAAGPRTEWSGELASVRVVQASETERAAHAARLQQLEEASADGCLWLKQEPDAARG